MGIWNLRFFWIDDQYSQSQFYILELHIYWPLCGWSAENKRETDKKKKGNNWNSLVEKYFFGYKNKLPSCLVYD